MKKARKGRIYEVRDKTATGGTDNGFVPKEEPMLKRRSSLTKKRTLRGHDWRRHLKMKRLHKRNLHRNRIHSLLQLQRSADAAA